MDTASVVFAAGKGSRMKGYEGNKTLLPLIPANSEISLYEGKHPILIQVLDSLPRGPKAIVVHHFADEVRRATDHLGVTYINQPVTNGTGGALICCRSFLEAVSTDTVIITMGDVPLILPATYQRMAAMTEQFELIVLAFEPRDKAQYGLLEIHDNSVQRIIEWKYWKLFDSARKASLQYCNAGLYAARRTTLLEFLSRLEQQPHQVQKQLDGRWVTIKEYFLTDLVELMRSDGRDVGMLAVDESEVTGVDTPEALAEVQERFSARTPTAVRE